MGGLLLNLTEILLLVIGLAVEASPLVVTCCQSRCFPRCGSLWLSGPDHIICSCMLVSQISASEQSKLTATTKDGSL